MAIPDPDGTYRIAQVVRNLNPKVYIIMCTRYVKDVEDLYKLGANEVIPEEFETSVEIFARVLGWYLIPCDEIDKLVSEVRADGYDMLRSMALAKSRVVDLELHIPEIEITGFRVEKETEVAGKTIREIQLRSQYGVTLLAIRCGDRTIPNPDTSEKKRSVRGISFI